MIREGEEGKEGVTDISLSLQLVCSSAVRSQLDGHLEEVTKLKGERWMKEGKVREVVDIHCLHYVEVHRMDQPLSSPISSILTSIQMRALRNHQNRRRKRRNGEEEPEIDHSPPSPERSMKFTPGIGQCEVLSPEEEVPYPVEVYGR